jgi:hypothetical protein
VTRRLARTDPTKRALDVLAYFDRPGTSNGPTEAINGRLEHLRGSALGFRNLTSYIARSLLRLKGQPAEHPVRQMTTYELRELRDRLEVRRCVITTSAP